jgi:hypothetical protein
MAATGWTNGQGTYGIRVGVKNRDRHFDRAWRTIGVDIDGHWHVCPLTPGFWYRCPELRHPAIRDWLQRHNRIPWPVSQPPLAELRPLAINGFRLTP